MHPLWTLFSCLSSPAARQSSPSLFWNDWSQVKSLADPPSPRFLKKIQDAPWKGGLEPVPPKGIPLHEVEIIQGKIPSDLQGMLCRNGPGRIRIGDSQYGHWFDGDGLVTKLSIDGQSQKATYSAKYVETDRFLAQQKADKTKNNDNNIPFAEAGAWTKRGTGKRWENLFAIPTNPSNTNIVFFPGNQEENGGQQKNTPSMYALAEGGDPVEVDPITLRTIGARPFRSAVGNKPAKSFFSAHYTQDPSSTGEGEIYNHGLLLFPKPAVNIMKLNGQTGELIHQAETVLPFLTFIHDNLLSENHFLLVIPPFAAPSNAMLEILLGGEPLGNQFTWSPKVSNSETTVMVFSKVTLECVARVPLPLLSTYHLVDAFEDPENSNILTLRTLVHDPLDSRTKLEDCFKDLYSAKQLPACRILEYTIDLEACQLVRSRSVAPKAAPCELPNYNAAWGYRKRYVYTNARTQDADFTDSLQKVDMDTGECSEVVSFGQGVIAGGPIFVPKENAKKEDEGYIFTQLYRSMDHGSDICILDAATMEKVALLRLDQPVPYQFHGSWQSGIL